ncbi:MAG: polysaccharide biosynthesis tyrosine autokinase [Desulfobacteraceae bacterium]|nr:MAG: polysaccharide biosynthesis tyrosine autokinase [Desulfobacteraceae bacterium]
MNEKEIHLRDYLRIIAKRKSTILTFFIITFTIVVIGTLTATPLYKASTKMLVEKSDSKPLLLNDYPIHFDPEFLETQFQIIKSNSVAKRVVELLSLDTNYYSEFLGKDPSPSLFGRILSWFSDLFSVMTKITGIHDRKAEDAASDAQEETLSPADSIAQIISSTISVEPVRNSRVVEVSYLSENPILAKLIVNTVAKAYIEEVLEMRMRASGYSVSWMSRKAEEERVKLDKAENALQQYIRDKDIVTIEDRVAIIPQKMAELSTQLTKAEAKRKELEALYKKLAVLPESEAETIPNVYLSKTYQSIQEQILKSEQNIAEVSKKYGKKHPVMKRSLGELQGLKEKKSVEIERVVKSVLNDFELAKTNEDDLRGLLLETKAEAVNLNEKFIQYGILKREVDTNRHLYNALVTKIKEQRITEKIQPVNVWVIDAAETPDRPAKPRKKLNILLGMLLGVFGGIGLVFFIEYLDNTIKSPEGVEENLRIPVLGVIPFSKKKNQRIENIVVDEPSSLVTENYRALRTSVMLSSADQPPKKILVTSMASGEGKTTTAANLASTIAKTGKNVLLIDADLRRPRLHKVFNLENTSGLSTFLSGISNGDILQKSAVGNLSIMTSGPIPPIPSELLNSSRMDKLVKTLSSKFDHIIFDSAPVMSVTDSQILIRFIDSIIVVVKSGRTTYEAAQKGLKILKDIDSHPIGMVINAVDTKHDGINHYYGYDGYCSRTADPS